MNDAKPLLWALAAGCVPDADPWDIPRIARAAGFKSCGMWVEPAATWDAAAPGRVEAALEDTGIELIDVEALWLRGGEEPTDDQLCLIDAGLQLGARNALVVCVTPDRDAAIGQFRRLCERAGSELRVNLEFGEFTEIRSLKAALDFVAAVDHPAAGVLVDLMHLNRSGEPLPDLTQPVYSYVQACDFYQSSAALSGADYIEAAVDARAPLGEGEAAPGSIATVCAAPIDVSLEIRSKALRDAYPNPYARAAQIFNRCRRSA